MYFNDVGFPLVHTLGQYFKRSICEG